jgi:hypothetical protein
VHSADYRNARVIAEAAWPGIRGPAGEERFREQLEG